LADIRLDLPLFKRVDVRVEIVVAAYLEKLAAMSVAVAAAVVVRAVDCVLVAWQAWRQIERFLIVSLR
jgi:hypothetical protein